MSDSPPSSTTSTPRGAPARVLVCDDDRLVLVTLVAALRRAGYEVIEADNGDDAILLARQHRPDIALLDIRMDGKSGLDVAAYLRDYVGTPFMFLSAFSDDEFIAKAREFGALDYLVKPIDFDLIAPAVEAALRSRAGGGAQAPESKEAKEAKETKEAKEIGAPPPRVDVVLDSRAGARESAAPAPARPRRPDAAAGAAGLPGATGVPAAAGGERLIAIGILMERLRLTRAEAERRLTAIARDEGRATDELAAAMVHNIDTLNSAGSR